MPEATPQTSPAAPAAPSPHRPRSVGNFRWVICALLFLATTVNYVDRQVIGLLKPILEQQFNWTESDYANIVSSFQLAYAIGLLLVGGILDRIGVRLGYALAILVWSVAAVTHGFMRSVTGFCAARFGLGLAEAANFPAGIKAVGEWFPKRQRALATGLFNSGTNTGALFGYVAGSSMSFGIRPDTGGNKVHYTNGLGCLVVPALSAGNLAVSGTQAYRNGVPEGDPIGIDPDNAGPIYIGARNQGIPYWYCAAYIQALALYGSVLTQAQVQAVQTAMAAL